MRPFRYLPTYQPRCLFCQRIYVPGTQLLMETLIDPLILPETPINMMLWGFACLFDSMNEHVAWFTEKQILSRDQ